MFCYFSDMKNFNKYIKKVCKRAGLSEIVSGHKFNALSKRKELFKSPKYDLFSSHDLRRSFATYHYYKGNPAAYIIKTN